jgi:hypothetical protein
MKRSASAVLLAFLAVAFGCGVLYLFNRRFAGGDAYPAYSTLRSDPVGAKVIYESLGRLPGVTVARSYQPLDRVADGDSTVLLLGLEPRGFAMRPDSEVRASEELARRGNRMVFAMGEASGRQPPRQSPLEKLWGVRFGLDFDKGGRGSLYFAEGKDWDVVERNVTRPVAIEKIFGKGSIVLVADGRVFDNRSVAEARQTALLAHLIGPHARIVFDESHFGIVESGSVVALARRFRLQGLAAGLAICAILFIWKNASSFPPVASAPREEKVVGRTSAAGLVTLLQRHVPADRLAAACRQEWLKGNVRDVAPARRAQAELALRKIETMLRAKGAI